ncbi:MAG: hypothetical protein DME26_19940 [Verrucomicrobia bacterium]|nr:MAG: hypothetical protein DME26_19940 [Verrucomicrobiota bacterium]
MNALFSSLARSSADGFSFVAAGEATRIKPPATTNIPIQFLVIRMSYSVIFWRFTPRKRSIIWLGCPCVAAVFPERTLPTTKSPASSHAAEQIASLDMPEWPVPPR